MHAIQSEYEKFHSPRQCLTFLDYNTQSPCEPLDADPLPDAANQGYEVSVGPEVDGRSVLRSHAKGKQDSSSKPPSH